jgi:hypothetical protein
MILPFLLHHANRSIHRIAVGKEEFYAIKKMLLQKGKHVNYDVQHFEGKKCWTCGGSGIYTGYYFSGGKWSDSCNRCFGGWYKYPMWVCLDRIKFGPYYFHQPLKRELRVKNPFTKEELGWEVTERTVVEGPIFHNATDAGWWSLLILFYLYDRKSYATWKAEILDQIRWRWIWKWRSVKKFFSWKTYVPDPNIRMHQLDMNGNVIDDYPFDYD